MASDKTDDSKTSALVHTRIKKLPPLLINQLAAGEVVTRPASVVKELVENAIDAQATSISIRIMRGGMTAISITDNGNGIHPDDMAMAVTRYATSKIADVANLQGIRTLGFRGEALAATAAVSRLTITSSPDNSGVGRELTVSGVLPDQPPLIPVIHDKGTTVRVQDLYFNVPARRRQLKAIATEFAYIETVVKQLALIANHVHIELWHDNKRRFCCEPVTPHRKTAQYGNPQVCCVNASAGMTEFQCRLLQRLSTLLPAVVHTKTHVLDVHVDLSHIVAGDSVEPSSIEGVLLPGDKQTADLPKLIYVNGRLVQDKRITHALKQSLQIAASHNDLHGSTLSKKDGYVLCFELPAKWLNVNVHPSKQTIKINHLMTILVHLQMAVRTRRKQWQKDDPNQTSKQHQDILSSTDVAYKPPQPPKHRVAQRPKTYQTHHTATQKHSGISANAADAQLTPQNPVPAAVRVLCQFNKGTPLYARYQQQIDESVQPVTDADRSLLLLQYADEILLLSKRSVLRMANVADERSGNTDDAMANMQKHDQNNIISSSDIAVDDVDNDWITSINQKLSEQAINGQIRPPPALARLSLTDVFLQMLKQKQSAE